jgi:xylulokinase
MGLVLGFDVGTQGTKGLAVDVEAGRVVARAARSYDLIGGLPPGAAEQHPQTWVDAVSEVAAELTADLDPHAVMAVGVSGQQHGCVLLDGTGKVLRPAKLWCDTSTAAEARELSEAFGRAVPTGFTASKILWSKRHEPDLFEQVRWVLLPHDYLNYRLTGELSMEAGDASGTGLFDPVERTFRPADARLIDERLPERLPGLLAAGAPAGVLSSQGGALLGLPEGVLVSAGGGDNMMSAVGSGATRPGVVAVSLGTSGTVFTHTDSPVVDPAGLIAPFCASVGGWLPLLCVMNLTGVTEEVARGFGADHAALTDAARDVPVGCDGLLWLPYLAGERVPDLPQATGTLEGMRPGHLRPGVLFRAAMEGTSLNLAWGVDRMRSLGIEVEAANLVGGAARNELWRSILADVLGCPVTALEEPESGALGAALQALWTWRLEGGEDVTAHEVAAPFIAPAAEPTAPDPGRREAYAELGARFRERAGVLYGAR